MTESLALSSAGGVVGLLLAFWMSDAVIVALGADAPYWIQFGVDARVLTFGVAITIATGALCGIMPALQAVRRDLHHTLRDGGAAVGSASGRRVRSVLASGQLALAVVLLAGAGLLIKTVIRTFQFDAGYDTSRVLVGDVELSGPRYRDSPQVLAFSAGVIERLERIPGVRAAVNRTQFFRGFGSQANRVTVEGLAIVPEDASPSFYHAVTAGYFKALPLGIREGRDFLEGETDVAIVNREMARRLWGTGPALGHRIRFGDTSSARWFTIVGVVDTRGGGPLSRQPDQPTAYVPLSAATGQSLTITLSTDRAPSSLAAEVRAAVGAVDPDLPVEDLMTMEQAFERWSAPARFVALLMGSLAAVALLMAAMGTFGVVAFAVSRRTREIGLRIALGATPKQVQQQMATGGIRLAVGGLAFGLPAAWLATRTLEGILAGTSPTDPVVFTGAAIVLALVALLASWLPARRAARVDPLEALRQE
jgi:predicted permease